MDTPVSHGEHNEFKQAIEAEFNAVRDENRRQNARIDKLEKQNESLTELTYSVHQLAENMTAMVRTQRDAEGRLQQLENRDAKHWQSAMKYLGTFVVGLISALAVAYARIWLGI